MRTGPTSPQYPQHVKRSRVTGKENHHIPFSFFPEVYLKIQMLTTGANPFCGSTSVRDAPYSSQRQGRFDEFLDAESNLSGDIRNASSGPGGFLQVAAFWFLDRGLRSGRDHHRSSDTVGENHSMTKPTMTLPHLTSVTAPGNTPKSNNVPSTSNYKKSRCTSLRPFIFQ